MRAREGLEAGSRRRVEEESARAELLLAREEQTAVLFVKDGLIREQNAALAAGGAALAAKERDFVLLVRAREGQKAGSKTKVEEGRARAALESARAELILARVGHATALAAKEQELARLRLEQEEQASSPLNSQLTT